MMYDIGVEFDELYKLVGLMGFSGSELEKMIAFILHSINEGIRGELNARSKV